METYIEVFGSMRGDWKIPVSSSPQWGYTKVTWSRRCCVLVSFLLLWQILQINMRWVLILVCCFGNFSLWLVGWSNSSWEKKSHGWWKLTSCETRNKGKQEERYLYCPITSLVTSLPSTRLCPLKVAHPPTKAPAVENQPVNKWNVVRYLRLKKSEGGFIWLKINCWMPDDKEAIHYEKLLRAMAAQRCETRLRHPAGWSPHRENWAVSRLCFVITLMQW